MSTQTKHTQHRLKVIPLSWLSFTLWILINTGHAQQYITPVNICDTGIHSIHQDFMINGSTEDKEVVFDQRKENLYSKNTGKKVGSGMVRRFCNVRACARTYTKEDTLRAVKYLFQRKRSGGSTRGVIGGAFLGAAIGQIASGNSTSNDAGNAIYLLVFGGIATSGIIQVGRYSKERLNRVLTGYEENSQLPLKIRKKLKKKDFKG